MSKYMDLTGFYPSTQNLVLSYAGEWFESCSGCSHFSVFSVVL